MIDDNLETGRRIALERLQQADNASIDNPFDRIVGLAATVLEAPSAGFAIITLERRHFRSSLNLPQPESTRLVAFCASGMLNDEPLIVGDTLQDARFSADPLVVGQAGIRFIASAPVRNPEMLSLGALCVLDYRPRQLSPAQIRSLGDLAALLEREMLLRSLMRIDPLTGLQTRFYYELEMDREWRRARRSRSPVTALLVDIDAMSEHNETFGTADGDRALGAIGHLLIRRFRRASDVLVRVGGDRMLVLLPETEAHDGLRLAHAIRREIELLALGNRHAGTTLTASIGCATASSDEDFNRGYEALIADAERALGAAKDSGGNGVSQHAAERRSGAPEARLSY